MSVWRSGGERERIMLITGAIVVSALLFVGRGLPALATMERAQRAAFVEAQAEATRLREANHVSVFSQESNERARATQVMLRARCIVAASGAEAASILVQHVTAVAAFSGVQVELATPRNTPTEDSGIATVAISLSVRSSGRAALDFIREIELGSPFVLVRSVRILQSDPAAPEDAGASLAVEFELAAVVLLERPGSAT